MATKESTKSAEPKETPRAKFVRLGNARGNRVLNSVRLLAGLATTGYEYSTADTEAIFAAIRSAVDKAEAKFSQPVAKRQVEPLTLVK